MVAWADLWGRGQEAGWSSQLTGTCPPPALLTAMIPSSLFSSFPPSRAINLPTEVTVATFHKIIWKHFVFTICMY